jgi:excisionase family DNA binding protein
MDREELMYPTLLSVEEVAKILFISRAYAYKLINEKKLPALKIGNTYRVRVDDLEQYIISSQTAKMANIEKG